MEELLHEDEIPVGRAKDLRGQVFGRLTVLYRVKNKGKQVVWRCVCECGATKDVMGASLTRGNTVSCGCYNKEKISNDLTGKRFGRLVALKPTGNKRRRYIEWECLCDCGGTAFVASGDLTYGSVTSCGCKNAIIDLVGQKFDKLTVVKLLEEKGPTGQAMWECVCDCGVIVKRRGTDLRYRNTHSCGSATCMGIEKDMTGMVFGKLTVISKSDFKNSYSNHTYWNCKCECGNDCVINGHNLRSGQTKSCGCLLSTGEMKIAQLLNYNKIVFEQQKRFDGCNLHDGGKCRFDFYINNHYLIEYDGQQHFESVDFFGGEEKFIIQQERDQYKNQWCKENNIPLIRIPYTKLDTLCIEDLMLETAQFQVV